MEYLAVALITLGYTVTAEYARLRVLIPHALSPFTSNLAVRFLTTIVGFCCLVYSIYSGIALWGWFKGLLLTVLVFPVLWIILLRFISGVDTLVFWIIASWLGAPVGVYLLNA